MTTIGKDTERGIKLALHLLARDVDGRQPIPLSQEEILLLCRTIQQLATRAKLVDMGITGEDEKGVLADPNDSPLIEPVEYPPELEHLTKLHAVLHMDEIGLKAATLSYGDSWKKRGGVGAFMMFARKWDRLERRAQDHGYNVFTAIRSDHRREGTIDDIRDLRRYLALVEAHAIQEQWVQLEDTTKDTDVVSAK
jgi:hypothetical protein